MHEVCECKKKGKDEVFINILLTCDQQKKQCRRLKRK